MNTTSSPMEVSKKATTRKMHAAAASAPPPALDALFSVEFVQRKAEDRRRSNTALKVANVVVNSFTKLFVDESRNPALACVEGGILWRLPRVQCYFPGPESAPSTLRVYRTIQEPQAEDPFVFAEKVADSLASALKPTRYYDPRLNLYTGGDRLMSHGLLTYYLAGQAVFDTAGHEEQTELALAERFALIGATVAWAVFEPLSFNVKTLKSSLG